MSMAIKKFALENYNSSNFAQSTHQEVGGRTFQSLSYAQLSHFWSYAGKVVIISRNLINASIKSCTFPKGMMPVLKQSVMHLKLFAAVSLFFGMNDLRSVAYKSLENFQEGDSEGMAVSSLSLSMTLTDVFDSAATFINTSLSLAAHDPVQLLSMLSLPVGFALSGMGTISRTVNIAKASGLYAQTESIQEIRHPDILKKRLEMLLKEDPSSTVETLKEKKKASLSRWIPKEASQALEGLFKLLDKKIFAKEDMEEAFTYLKNIGAHLEKKMQIDVIGIIANLILFFALTLFSIGVTTATPFLLIASSFSIRVMSLIYQEQPLQPTR